MRLAVAMTVSSARPWYLEPVLESWAQVRGISQVSFAFCCEPGDGPMSAQMCRRFLSLGLHGVVLRHGEQLGPVENTRYALEAGLSRGDFVVCTEEDVIVADDILEYFGWCAEHYASDRSIAGVCGFISDSDLLPRNVFRYPFFSPLAWGTWRDRWPEISEDWGGLNANPRAWDRRMHIHQCLKRGRDFIFPQASRAQHIGQDGMHSQAYPGWYEQTRSVNFRDHYRPQEFQEVGAVYTMPPDGTPPLYFLDPGTVQQA